MELRASLLCDLESRNCVLFVLLCFLIDYITQYEEDARLTIENDRIILTELYF